VPDHEQLFPRLFGGVVPGGLLAVQMPLTATSPYHLGIARVRSMERWHERLAGVEGLYGARPAQFYYDLLAPFAADVDVWETDYHHVLDNLAQVVEWASGTALVPFLTALTEEEKPAFLADYTAALAADYSARPNGKVLFIMRRLFIRATRA
jgi:trans-aconitate 2-methyltransferase